MLADPSFVPDTVPMNAAWGKPLLPRRAAFDSREERKHSGGLVARAAAGARVKASRASRPSRPNSEAASWWPWLIELPSDSWSLAIFGR
jgi:hypothetical protein